jgi:glycosyltransferase involved in cell wall biosynthesis
VRLLFVSTVYPTPWQPVKGAFNRALVAALAQDHDVRVLAPVTWPVAFGLEGPKRDRLAPPPGVPGVVAAHPVYYYPPKLLRHRYDWFLWRSVAPAARRLTRSWVPDAVVGYWAHPDGAAALRVGRSAGCPVAILVGGSDIRLLAQEPARRAAILGVLRAADLVWAVGGELRARLLDLGLPESKVRTFYRGVSPCFSPGSSGEARRRLGLDGGRPLALWVGHMVPVKGLDVLVDAFARLTESGLDARLVLVGDGPLRARLEARAAQGPLAGRVVFAGAVPNADLPDFYRAADVTVLPSLSEGVPNVLLESLACGTPFVASAVGGVPELTRDPARDLVPPGDAGALADRLAARLRDRRRADPDGFRAPSWADAAAQITGDLRALPSSPVP